MGERVEIVRAMLEMFRRREHETPFAFYADDVVLDASQLPGLAGGGVYHGHAGVREFWRAWLASWADIEWEYEVVEGDRSEDQVVVDVSNQRNLGRESRIWVEQGPYRLVFGFRGNEVVSLKYELPNRD